MVVPDRVVAQALKKAAKAARGEMSFSRENVEPHRVGFENRRDLGEFLTGGW
jgi:hypothetical protein